tara:strand:- start:231 stop:470 length:240 start_codon:yes stop_codon:yes gene_type:complete
MKKLPLTKEYLKSIDSIENEKIISFVDLYEKYFDWFTNECGDQYDELYWLINSAINPTKQSSKNVSDVMNDTYNIMNER